MNLLDKPNVRLMPPKETADTAAVDQRPFLVPGADPYFTGSNFGLNQPLIAATHVKNVGRTPAIKMLIKVDLVYFGPQTGDFRAQVTAMHTFLDSQFGVLSTEQEMYRQSGSPYVEDDVAPAAEFWASSYETPVNLTEPQFNDISNPTRGGANYTPGAWFFVGLVTYFDNFERPHRTEICYYHAGAALTNWTICKSHNLIR